MPTLAGNWTANWRCRPIPVTDGFKLTAAKPTFAAYDTIPSVIIYETEDSDFADSAIGALKKANIDCYRTGGSLHFGKSDPTICIHVRDGTDLRKANEVLIRHGAVVEQPLRLPSGWVAWTSIGSGLLLLVLILAWLLK
jgi:hypothetical protein